jgi:hypothetical protein
MKYPGLNRNQVGVFYGGEAGIRTLGTGTVHTLSRRAP